jgi:hypothetical protein
MATGAQRLTATEPRSVVQSVARATGRGSIASAARLFGRLENGTPDELTTLGFDRPCIVDINGMVKKNA